VFIVLSFRVRVSVRLSVRAITEKTTDQKLMKLVLWYRLLEAF